MKSKNIITTKKILDKKEETNCIDFLTFVTSKFTQNGTTWTNEKGDIVTPEDIFKIYKDQE